MTLTAREQFIFHVAYLMTLDNNGLLGNKSLLSLVESVLTTRCRELTDKQVEQLLSDIDNEVEICMDDFIVDKKNLEDFFEFI